MRALAKGAALLGTEFLFGNPVTSFLREGDRVTGVEVNGEAHYGDTFAIASGCWSGGIAALLGYSLSIEPARGQIVLVEAMPPILGHVINGRGVYLVPRSDGKILIGATVEFVGYDKRTTLEGTRQMIEAGIALVPALAERSFVQTWVGLRPYAKGDPYLGKLSRLRQCDYCIGAFQNRYPPCADYGQTDLRIDHKWKSVDVARSISP